MGQIFSRTLVEKNVPHTADLDQNGAPGKKIVMLQSTDVKESTQDEMINSTRFKKEEKDKKPESNMKEENSNEENANKVNSDTCDSDAGETDREYKEDKQKRQLDVWKDEKNNNLRIKEANNNNNHFDHQSFIDDVLKRKVVLEDIFVSGKEVSGVIAVSYDEEDPLVTVRYSSDCWETILNEKAIPFTAGQDDSKAIKRFFFLLFVPCAEYLEFAVRRKGDCGIYWDNNNCKNYSVQIVKEKESQESLMGKFTLQRDVMFDVMVKKKSVTLKNVSLKDGKVLLAISTEESFKDFPDVCYTFDNWASTANASEVVIKRQEEGQNILEIQIDLPNLTKVDCNIL